MNYFRRNIKQGRTLKPEDDACTTVIYFYLEANVNRYSIANNKKIIGWKWNLYNPDNLEYIHDTQFFGKNMYA